MTGVQSSLSYVDDEWPVEIPRPPTVDELPYDDGVPMESQWHRDQMNLLADVGRDATAARGDVYVAGNMGLFYSASQKKPKNEHRAPDCMVIIGAEDPLTPRKAWVIWEEDALAPSIIVEVTSD